MTQFVGLSTAVILGLLAIQAEPITGFLGLTWAALHAITAVVFWHGTNS
jgi:hypothetical protein